MLHLQYKDQLVNAVFSVNYAKCINAFCGEKAGFLNGKTNDTNSHCCASKS